MDAVQLLLLALVAFIAGAINAVAGGGSLISFPMLIAAGYSTKTANVTNTVALWPGYIGGSLGYREELRTQRRRLARLAVPSVLGAIAGSIILLATPTSTFDVIVPFLILFAALLMAFQDQLAAAASRRRLVPADDDAVPLPLHLAAFALGIYGAYFGAALGILTLAFFAVFIPDDIQRSNALKGMTSLITNAVAVVIFVAIGPVRWAPAAVMAVGAVAGGYAGVGVARRLGRRWLRAVVVVYGFAVAAVLFARLFT